ncbi:MAG TPA: aldose 1-epimerase family protein [Caldilineaceae bacterium]|nr:aldose 1-epimerase family protein [Caldilineaceae bacterium]
MQLYNRSWSRRELEARVGRLEQVAGLRRFTLAEGNEAGVEQIQVRTGAGLCYYVSPQRGLDISLAEFGGVPLSWQSPNGDVHPAYYDDRGLAWLRTAAGGLLMTCGFTQAGAPTVDQGQELGLHGRAHHLPARQLCTEGIWEGDEYTLRIAGLVEETIIFGEFIRLTREIRSRLGSNRIALTDRFENLAFAPAPLMLLYHFNFGFPLLDEATTFSFPSRKVEPRDAGTPLEGYRNWQPPEPNHQERVYLHNELETDAQGWAAASIHNPAFPLPGGPRPLTVRLAWDTSTLPSLVQWRMAGTGTHVLGIEPTNCNVRGRAAARADGSLVFLEPGETAVCRLELAVEVG